jgi:hypothetical protein
LITARILNSLTFLYAIIFPEGDDVCLKNQHRI